MPSQNLVVVGASAGGVDALIRVVRGFPADLDAAVLVVLHLPPDALSNLPRILGRSGPLPAETAEDGMALQPGRILCAPPDHHLTVRDGHIRVARGPHENLHRPSVDVLFRSAALSSDGSTCGIVLSGALDDGTSGMRAIQRAGGLTIVQDPADALVPGMPESVLEVLTPDHILPADEIGRCLAELLRQPVRAREPMLGAARATLEQEVAMSQMDAGATDGTPAGHPSPFGCPDCGGVLWELDDNGGLRFRCRIGHAYSARSLIAAEDGNLEDTLWAALRALEEQESLSRRLLERSAASGGRSESRLRERMEEASRRADVLRDFLLQPVSRLNDPEAAPDHTVHDAVTPTGNGSAPGNRTEAARAR